MPVVPFIPAIIGAGGAILGGVLASKGAKDAAKEQSDAAKSGTATQLYMYNQSRGDLAPYSKTGEAALYKLGGMYGLPTPDNPKGGQAFSNESLREFRHSPDYRVARREGIRGLDASAAASGDLFSGRQGKAIARFSSDLATSNFGSYMDRLASLAGLGENAAATTGNNGIATGRGVASTQLATGEARASGIVGANNAWTDAIGSGLKGFFSGGGGNLFQGGAA